VFTNRREVDQILPELFSHRVKHQDDAMFLLEMSFEEEKGIFLVDSHLLTNEHTLQEIGEFFVICLCVGWNDECPLEHDVEFFFLQFIFELVLLEEED
jgi:hypothetical protein